MSLAFINTVTCPSKGCVEVEWGMEWGWHGNLLIHSGVCLCFHPYQSECSYIIDIHHFVSHKIVQRLMAFEVWTIGRGYSKSTLVAADASSIVLSPLLSYVVEYILYSYHRPVHDFDVWFSFTFNNIWYMYHCPIHGQDLILTLYSIEYVQMADLFIENFEGFPGVKF